MVNIHGDRVSSKNLMKKKKFWIIFNLLSMGLVFSFLIWIFSSYSFDKLFNYAIYLKFLILFGISIMLISSLTLTIISLKLNLNSITHKSIKFFKIISVFILLIPVGAFGSLTIMMSHPAGDIPPQLFVCDGTGKYNVPDFALS